jgi:nitric oxide reductase subunit B
MLVYGTAILVMEKISGDETLAASKLAFSLFFLGLFNLMFGWAHHAYPVPAAPWIRHFAYVVSMTELLVLGKIIWDWRGTVATWRRFRHRDACRFLFAADLWVFLNLLLAIVISIPAANLFTHGTHVTVAHAMGTTIGINTMILLASVFYVIETRASEAAARRYRTAVRAGFWLTNGALLAFFLALIGAGLVRGTFAGSFAEMTAAVAPWLVVFTVAGVGLMAGLWMILLPATRTIWGLVAPRRRAIAPSAAE